MMVFVVMVTALAAGFIQAVSGFGGAMVMMMTLPYFFPMTISTALAGMVNVPILALLAWRYREKINVKMVFLPAVTYLIVSGICIKIASLIDLDGMKAIFGLLLIALALYFNFFSNRIRIKANVASALICGGISGVTGGLFGIGGPLMVLYYLSTTKDKGVYLGTINLLFTITESYSAIMRFANGIISLDQGVPIVCGFAAILVGQQVGSRVVDKLDGEKMKKIIYLLLGLSGLITFIRAM